LEVGEGQEKTASGEAGLEAAGSVSSRSVAAGRVSSSTRAPIARPFWATTGTCFEEQGKGSGEEGVVEVGVESEDDGEGDFAHISRLPPRRVRRSLLT
jgi:hypothetical protein